eukprot:7386397-Prymnesium_polylepis.1
MLATVLAAASGAHEGPSDLCTAYMERRNLKDAFHGVEIRLLQGVPNWACASHPAGTSTPLPPISIAFSLILFTVTQRSRWLQRSRERLRELHWCEGHLDDYDPRQLGIRCACRHRRPRPAGYWLV